MYWWPVQDLFGQVSPSLQRLILHLTSFIPFPSIQTATVPAKNSWALSPKSLHHIAFFSRADNLNQLYLSTSKLLLVQPSSFSSQSGVATSRNTLPLVVLVLTGFQSEGKAVKVNDSELSQWWRAFGNQHHAKLSKKIIRKSDSYLDFPLFADSLNCRY